MADLDDVRRLARALPGAQERQGRDGTVSWTVRGTGFVWERPLRRGDLAALGNAAPTGTVLGVRVADEGVKQALLSADADVLFTTPHFDGYPAVLVRLDDVSPAALEESSSTPGAAVPPSASERSSTGEAQPGSAPAAVSTPRAGRELGPQVAPAAPRSSRDVDRPVVEEDELLGRRRVRRSTSA